MIRSTTIVVLSYAILISILLVPQINETKVVYMKRLKIIMMFIIPCIVSIITIKCMEESCPDFAHINALIIMIWSVSVATMYLFKKLI